MPTSPPPAAPLPYAAPLFVLEEYFSGGPAYTEQTPQPAPWGNLLVHSDNIVALEALGTGALARCVQAHGGIKLIYSDPPFAVGANFSMPIAGAAGKGTGQHAYADIWPARKDFLEMLEHRLRLMHSLLAEDGALFLHCDWRTSAHVRLLLDAIFGEDRFLGEIIWHYTGGGRSTRYFSRKHDTIFHYAKSARWTFHVDAVRVPYKPTSGYAKGGITARSGKHYHPHPGGTPVDDVWDIPMLNPLARERLGYPTQKPEALLERIIAAASSPGDIVADFFCGSGTTLAVAQRMGRKWIGCDAGGLAVHTSRKRLLALSDRSCPEGCTPPFLVLHPSVPLLHGSGGARLQARGEAAHGGIHIALTGFVPCLPEGPGGPAIALPAERLALEGDTLVCLRRGAAAQETREVVLAGWHKFLDYWAVGVWEEAEVARDGAEDAGEAAAATIKAAAGAGKEAEEGLQPRGNSVRFVSLWQVCRAHGGELPLAASIPAEALIGHLPVGRDAGSHGTGQPIIFGRSEQSALAVQVVDIFGQVFWAEAMFV